MMLDMLRDLNLMTIAFRIFLALLLGGMIGLERGSKNQPAGFRTYMLVCLGATIVMLTNQYIVDTTGNGDPSRLGAQVISGIGFLGAGTIIVTKRNQVRGLTTAAGLWSSACLGLAIGIGFYEGAFMMGIAILLIMTFLQRIEYLFRERSIYMRLYTNFTSVDAMNRFVEVCILHQFKVLDIQISKIQEETEKDIVVLLYIKTLQRCTHADVIRTLSTIEGLKFIEEI